MRLTMIAFGCALAAPVAAAQAGEFVVLSGDSTMTVFDSQSRKALRSMSITGVKGRMAGIDVRPSDNMLYGLTEHGAVVTIDVATGKAAMKSTLETMLGKGVAATIDFNPVADRLRIIGSDGTNLRANVDDGKVVVDKALNYADTDANKGKKPMVTAGAYSNSVKGAKETALYDIDTSLNVWLKQAPPNDGVLTTMTPLKVKGKVTAFDIASDGMGGNEGWLLAGKTLYRVDIATGNATRMGDIVVNGAARDLAVLPAM